MSAARPALDQATTLATQATPLVARLNATDAAGSLQTLGALARALPADQVALLIGRLSRLLSQVHSSGLVGQSTRAAADVPSLVRLQRRLLRIQLASLGAQRQTLATQLSTLQIKRQTLAAQLHALDIAQQTLNHVESLDHKTGGTLPAAPAVPAGR